MLRLSHSVVSRPDNQHPRQSSPYSDSLVWHHISPDTEMWWNLVPLRRLDFLLRSLALRPRRTSSVTDCCSDPRDRRSTRVPKAKNYWRSCGQTDLTTTHLSENRGTAPKCPNPKQPRCAASQHSGRVKPHRRLCDAQHLDDGAADGLPWKSQVCCSCC